MEERKNGIWIRTQDLSFNHQTTTTAHVKRKLHFLVNAAQKNQHDVARDCLELNVTAEKEVRYKKCKKIKVKFLFCHFRQKVVCHVILLFVT